MTVSSLITSKQYTSNGIATQYAFPNKVFAATDLVVTLIDLAGNQYPFTNFSNATTGLSYQVQGIDVDTGCTVVFSGVQTSGWTVDIRSVTADTQSTSIKNQGLFLPELHEEAFDRATRQIQDLLRQTYTYGIHGPDIENAPWQSIPGAKLRASQWLGFDTNGSPIVGIPTPAPGSSVVLPTFMADQVGCIGNGIFDNTTIINGTISALAAAGGGALYFTPGKTYAHTSSLILASNVWLVGPATSTLAYSGAAQQITSATTGVLLNAGIVGLTLNAGSSSTKVLELYSSYRGTFRDLRVICTSNTNFVVDLLTNTSGATCPDGNYNSVYNDFSHITLDGSATCGTFIRLKGGGSTSSVVTLNTFHNCSTGGGSTCAVRGVDFSQWCDSNYFSGVTRLCLVNANNSSACGVEWNTSTPTVNAAVYANNFAHLAVDCFGTPTGDSRVGIRMGWTKYNKVEYYFNEPAAAGGAVVLDATNTQSYYINHIVGGTSNIVVRQKLTYFGGTDNPRLLVGGDDISTQQTSISVGLNRSGSGFSNIDLIGDTTYTAYGLRIIRNNTGANTSSVIHHHGTGNFTLQCDDAGGQIILQANAGLRFVAGDTGIGFYGTGQQAKQTVTGSKGGNAALASLMTALANIGLVTDSTT